MKRQEKQDTNKREAFTTNINSKLLHEFRVHCATKEVYQNDIIEKLVKDLFDGKKTYEISSKRPKKQDGVEREAFTTSMKSDLLHEFRIYCVRNKMYQNDVIEKLMRDLLEEGSEDVGNTD